MTSAAHSNSVAFPVPCDAATGWTWVMTSAVDGLQSCASACMAWQQETARFLDMRITDDQRAWAALLSSRDVAGAMKTQQEWALKTATDYAKEATRLTRLATTLALTGTTPAVQRVATLMV